VYSGRLRAPLSGRNGRALVEVTVLMLRIRRREARKVAKLARALAALDREPHAGHTRHRRAARISVSA
jgi:hypothetical protein